MLSITQLQPGIKILWNNDPYEVVSSEHVQMGRGGGIQRVKIKNLKDGTILDQTFKGNQLISAANLERKPVQFLYVATSMAMVMDPTSFDQLQIPVSRIKDQIKYLKEGDIVDSLWFEGQLLAIQIPIKMTSVVTHTEPGLRGDRQTAGTKPATTETGAAVHVPLFIKVGDKIVVDTRTGKYVERAK